MERKTILVVDDDPDVQDIVAQALERAGYDVRIACNGRDALALVEPELYAILLDWRMPTASGADFLGAVGEDVMSAVPIVVFSGSPRIDEPRITVWLSKPTSLDELLHVLEHIRDDDSR